jgi:leucyl-tRNA synthetase
VRDVEEVTEAINELKLREAVNTIYFIILNRIREFKEMLEESGRGVDDTAKWTLKYLVERWVKLMAPFTPFFAEEMWHLLGKETFVTTEPWPATERELLNPLAEASKAYVEKLIDDIKEIIKVAKIEKPKKVRIEVAPKEAHAQLKMALDYIKEGRSMREFMSEAVKKFGKRSAPELKKVYQHALSLESVVKEAVLNYDIDEEKILKEFKNLIEKRVGAPVEITTYSGGKKKPLPLKPAIYVE